MPPHGVALAGDSVIDISHESLIRQWGRLRTWVEEEAESRATYLRLVEAARLRQAGKAGLWGEPDLTYARQWQEREAPNATWAERYGSGFDDARAFLRDSEAAHAAELEQERQQAEAERIAKERELEQAKALAEAQRQRADEQAAARIRQRRLSWGLAAILGLALGAAGFGWYQRDLAREQVLAEQQARIATARRLGDEARNTSSPASSFVAARHVARRGIAQAIPHAGGRPIPSPGVPLLPRAVGRPMKHQARCRLSRSVRTERTWLRQAGMARQVSGKRRLAGKSSP